MAVTKYLLLLLRFSLLGLLLVPAACQRQPMVFEQQFVALGTLVDIKLYDVDEKVALEAIKAVEADFQYMHKTWHAWKEGPVTRINGLIKMGGQTISVAPSVLPLIKRAQELSAQSEGLFNPAAGELLHLWGFQSDEPPTGPPPAQADIDKILAQAPKMSDLHLDGIKLTSSNTGVRLDFGGFAKGVAIDYAIQRLKDYGIKNAVVNAGGDLRAIGKHGKRAWRVGIQNPRGSGVIGAIDVEGDACVFTSGDYERYFEYQGVRYSHIIDPRSGYPARGLTSVTVLDNDAGRADAAATAIFVAGVTDWYRIAKKMGVQGVMVVDSKGQIYMDPVMKKRVYFKDSAPSHIIVSDPLH